MGVNEVDRWCNRCQNYGNGLCIDCTNLEYFEWIKEYNCKHFYKGYCAKYEDGCFRQCESEETL